MSRANIIKNPNQAIAAAIGRAAQAACPNPISLKDFASRAWRIIEPATPLQLSWHHELILEHLEMAFLRQVTRLVINVPPRTLKSILTSVLWPDWGWTRAPWTRWVFNSYSLSLATEFSVKRRRILRDDWFTEKWGNSVKLAGDQDLKTEFENLQTGKMTATSTGGTLTGKGGDFIVMDDPQNPQMAESEVERKATNDFYSNTLLSRLNVKRLGVIVLVQQRLHAEDTTSLVLKEGGWQHVCVQAMASARKTYSFPISKREVEVAEGELMHPSREGLVEFSKMRRAMGSRTHDAQYQQAPSAETGNIWKRHWWRFYKELPGGFDVQIQSWDAAFKQTPGSSFVVGQVWGLRGAQKYLLAQTRERMDYPATKKAIQAMTAMWPRALAKLIEDKANGPALISDLSGTVSGIVPIQPVGDKIVRANAVAATIEAGDVWLPDPSICGVDDSGRPWVESFIEECAAFPESQNNDQVDAASQALVRLNELALTLSPERLQELTQNGEVPKFNGRRQATEQEEEFEEQPDLSTEVFEYA